MLIGDVEPMSLVLVRELRRVEGASLALEEAGGNLSGDGSCREPLRCCRAEDLVERVDVEAEAGMLWAESTVGTGEGVRLLGGLEAFVARLREGRDGSGTWYNGMAADMAARLGRSSDAMGECRGGGMLGRVSVPFIVGVGVRVMRMSK